MASATVVGRLRFTLYTEMTDWRSAVRPLSNKQALEPAGAHRLWNESFFSAPQLTREPLGGDNRMLSSSCLPRYPSATCLTAALLALWCSPAAQAQDHSPAPLPACRLSNAD